MNCQNFEAIINDLARERMMDAMMRESCLSHAADCANCAARLRDERALTSGLRALAANVATSVEAPPRVEASLLKAFRARLTQRSRMKRATRSRCRQCKFPIQTCPSRATRRRRRWMFHIRLRRLRQDNLANLRGKLLGRA